MCSLYIFYNRRYGAILLGVWIYLYRFMCNTLFCKVILYTIWSYVNWEDITIWRKKFRSSLYLFIIYLEILSNMIKTFEPIRPHMTVPCLLLFSTVIGWLAMHVCHPVSLTDSTTDQLFFLFFYFLFAQICQA